MVALKNYFNYYNNVYMIQRWSIHIYLTNPSNQLWISNNHSLINNKKARTILNIKKVFVTKRFILKFWDNNLNF